VTVSSCSGGIDSDGGATDTTFVATRDEHGDDGPVMTVPRLQATMISRAATCCSRAATRGAAASSHSRSLLHRRAALIRLVAESARAGRIVLSGDSAADTQSGR
jgi:hypothetical protein